MEIELSKVVGQYVRSIDIVCERIGNTLVPILAPRCKTVAPYGATSSEYYLSDNGRYRVVTGRVHSGGLALFEYGPDGSVLAVGHKVSRRIRHESKPLRKALRAFLKAEIADIKSAPSDDRYIPLTVEDINTSTFVDILSTGIRLSDVSFSYKAREDAPVRVKALEQDLNRLEVNPRITAPGLMCGIRSLTAV